MDWIPSVLVLDEDTLALELYSRELAQDYQVLTSESVAEARQRLRNTTFDVLIVEPAVDGDEGWTLLKEIQAMRNPPLIIVCSVEDERKAGLELGAHLFLVKPVLPVTLHNLLDHIVARTPSSNVDKLDKGT